MIFLEVCSHNHLDPSTVLLKINGTKCNMACYYCSETKKSYKTSMSLSECSKIISELPTSCDIILHGGEPLLDIDLFRAALSAFKKKNSSRKLSIQTNGCINDDVKALLLENRDILHIGISIDGPAEDNALRLDPLGNPIFLDTDRTIRFFEENGIPIKCISTINAININHPIEILSYFISHKNIMQIRFNPCFDVCENLLSQYSITPSQFFDFITKISSCWLENNLYRRIRVDPIQAEIENLLYSGVNDSFRGLSCYKFVSLYPGNRATLCDALGIDEFGFSNYSDIFQSAYLHFSESRTLPCMQCPDSEFCDGGCPAIFSRFNFSPDLIREYCNYRKSFRRYIMSLINML